MRQPCIVVIYKALCFDVAQGQMNGAPNETRTHSCRFANSYTIRGALTRVVLLVKLANRYTTRGALVIYESLCSDVAQGRMNGVPNETTMYYSNLQSSLLRCGTRPNEWGAR